MDPSFSAELSRRLTANDTSPANGLVRATRTPLSGSQAADALHEAWTRVQGEPPSRQTLAILAGQWAHETGRGASMLNFNFGGIKGTGPSGLSAEYRTREGWGAGERRVVDRFRAYRTASEGATDYVRLLSDRYPAAVQAARRGDAAGFVAGLKARGYFTGNERAYVRSVTALSHEAIDLGFDALGAGHGPTERSFAPAGAGALAGPLPRDAVAGSLTAESPIVGVQAIADELGRAALRIAGSEASDDGREGR